MSLKGIWTSLVLGGVIYQLLSWIVGFGFDSLALLDCAFWSAATLLFVNHASKARGET